MTKVIEIKFKPEGRGYFFDPNGVTAAEGDCVIVETARGVERGTVAAEAHEVDDNKIVSPLKKVIRAATEEDLKQIENNKKREREAFEMGEKLIIDHNLDMKLVEVECAFDGSKIVFFFTAEERVDFRGLVKDLAQAFRTRIEMRQIGVRDEAKLLGGLGICGQPFCCSRFLDDFQPVSIKMAKEQGLSLNPTKISGSCGRLMCCLKYEQDAYEYLLSFTPRVGWTVMTERGEGVVVDSNPLTGALLVRLSDEDAAPFKVSRDDVKVIKKSRPGKKKQPSQQED